MRNQRPSVVSAEPPARESGGAGRAPTRRRQATRERVLDAARDVFAERGVYGATVEDICARAGFTRGAFYSSFRSKDDALHALIEREHARLLGHLDASFDRVEVVVEPTAGPGLQRAMGAVVDDLLRSVPTDRLFSLVQGELEIHAVRDPTVARSFVAADARFRARIADLLVRGLRMLEREPTVSVEDATDAVIAIVERSTRRALLRGDGSDPNDLAVAMLPLLVLAISRPLETGPSG